MLVSPFSKKWPAGAMLGAAPLGWKGSCAAILGKPQGAQKKERPFFLL
ncbi:hypothetical protein [Ottowia sp.]|nr:hypothetical protein [Ottowia sp.]MCP5258025.1 hypothetical protein [Burkholderiaceae bacterium]MCB2026419.1 hypothetical protein [Ottowia sp.]MCB2034328.1 hypothetical protein [Ottowia sp.]MCB2037259.1 hypothetical protein [Ottowia sp.]HPR45359.1 hypothetical protein [Ottowia sp.]